MFTIFAPATRRESINSLAAAVAWDNFASGAARCRRCGGAIADRGPDAWIPFADGSAAHLTCEDRWELQRLRARAENALTPDALADEAEVTVRGGPLP